MPVLANGERLVFESDRHGAPVARHFFFYKLGNYDRKPVRRAGRTVLGSISQPGSDEPSAATKEWTMATPVLFIHGLWLHATSWEPWTHLFEDAGYEPHAPGWPGDGDTVEASRRSLKLNLVVPKDIEASQLNTVLTRKIKRMPYDSPLPDKDIELIQTWIMGDAGKDLGLP